MAAQKKPAKKRAASAHKSTPKKRPIRREVGSFVFALLALCALVSYVQPEPFALRQVSALCRGLTGRGYYLAAPAFALAAWILLRHRGRPVLLRMCCALGLPVLLGALVHTVSCTMTFATSAGILRVLWRSGLTYESGGAISGFLAYKLVPFFGKPITLVLFAALMVVCMMAALKLTPEAVAEAVRAHRPVPYEPEPEPERKPAAPRKTRSRIDIPLDGDEPEPQPQKEAHPGFFARRSEHVRTPDELLTEPTPAPKSAPRRAPKAEPAEPDEPVRPSPAPVPVPEPEPAPVPAPLPAEPPVQKTAARDELAAAAEQVAQEINSELEGEAAEYRYPPITLLDEGSVGNASAAGAELRNNARRLAETLQSFGVDAQGGEVIRGPSVTRYEFTLDQGVKLSKVTNLADDIALALGASGVRIAPIPDKISVVGIEVPNKQVSPVSIRSVLESREFTTHKSSVAFAVGKDIGGHNIIGNIEKLPHVLIAGTTGSGKSVCTNSLIVSLLYKSTPDEVRFIMVDPKMVELAPYNGIPHLLIPVVTDPKKAAGALQWAVYEMMKRYKLFSEHNVKNLAGYNAVAAASDGELKKLPSVVVVIDELADLMLVAAKEVEESICRVAQMGRAAGMHLVIATQRPSADVITGLMKANIPSRIAFAVASSLESRIILDSTGAEKLVGRGDMLYAPLGEGKPRRVQGCLISAEEIERVVAFVKENGEASYSDEVIRKIEESVAEKEKGSKGAAPAADAEPEDDGDELLPQAVEVVLETGQASVSMLQRRLKLGYSRAARLVDQMEQRGIVGPFEGSKPRALLITREQWQEQQLRTGAPLPPAPPMDDED